MKYKRKGKQHTSLSCSRVQAPSCVHSERKGKMKRYWVSARGVNGISIFHLLPEPAWSLFIRYLVNAKKTTKLCFRWVIVGVMGQSVKPVQLPCLVYRQPVRTNLWRTSIHSPSPSIFRDTRRHLPLVPIVSQRSLQRKYPGTHSPDFLLPLSSWNPESNYKPIKMYINDWNCSLPIQIPASSLCF